MVTERAGPNLYRARLNRNSKGKRPTFYGRTRKEAFGKAVRYVEVRDAS